MLEDVEPANGSEPEASFSFHKSTAREMESPSTWRAINHLIVSISRGEFFIPQIHRARNGKSFDLARYQPFNRLDIARRVFHSTNPPRAKWKVLRLGALSTI